MAASADEDQLRRRYRALADPSRARILSELSQREALDTRELAHRVGLHVNTVRAHMVVLRGAGLVRAQTLPPQGRGRPPVAYSAVGDAPDASDGRHYRLLAEILTTLARRYGDEATAQLEEIGEAWGRRLVESPQPSSELSDAEAVERLLTLLTELGFQPDLETGRHRRILMRPCPFLELARRNQDVVCPIHLGLMRGALAESGATTRTTSLEPFLREDLCVAHLGGVRR